MTAAEFIKMFGWEHGKDVSNGWITNYENIDLNELKSYIEAYELVQSYGGVGEANKLLWNPEITHTKELVATLEKAIKLVEEIEC